MLRLISSHKNVPILFSHPTPERLHMECLMNKVASENAILRSLLKSERQFNDSLCKENTSLRTICDGDDMADDETVATSMMTPLLPDEGRSRRCLCCKRVSLSSFWNCFR